MLGGGKIWSYPDLPHSVEVRGKVKVSPKQPPGYQDAIQQCTDTSHLFMALHLKDQTHLDILIIKYQYRTQTSRGWDHCAASSAKPYCTRGRNCVDWEKKHYALKIIASFLY